jgi:hypothetical protein
VTPSVPPGGGAATGRPRGRRHPLIALYPRNWRARYQDEFDELVEALAAERRGHPRLARWWLAVDMVRGAFDAHLRWRPETKPSTVDPALRRGLFDGLMIAVVIATGLVLTNVVFPPGPNESDDDPEYLVQLAAAYLLLAVLLVVIGVRARRRSANPWAGALGGGVAGLVMAVVVAVATTVIDNAFFDIVSQQHDKRVAFEASGWSSMRAFINFQLVRGIPVVFGAGTLIGGLLGSLGGAIAGPPRHQPAR